MRNGKVLPIGIVAMVLVVALAALSVGYALWYKNLYIEGTIETGNVDVVWSVEGFYADGDEKEISSIDCRIEGDTLVFEVTNGYPSVWYTCEFNVESTGTIPVHLIGPTVTEPSDECLDFSIDDLTSEQLHLGDIAYGTIAAHMDNTCPQNSTIGFRAELLAHQYNEAPP